MVDESLSDKPQPEKTQIAMPRLRDILLVFVIAFGVRAVVVILLSENLKADPDAYRLIAENVRQTGVYTSSSEPTAFRPPLYPLMLAGLAVNGHVTVSAVGALHVVLGVATALLTYLATCRWGLGRWSLFAAGLVACDPLLLNQSTLVMTETLATFLAMLGLFVLTVWAERPSLRRSCLAGVVIGVACVCRPTFIPWLGLTAVMMALNALRHCAERGRPPSPQPSPASGRGSTLAHLQVAIGSPFALILCAGLVVAPWMVRNYVSLGTPKATTTHGGYTVLLGNNPSFYRYLREAPSGSTWDAVELAEAWELRRHSSSPSDPMWNLPHDPNQIDRSVNIERTELEDDDFAYSLAKRYIRDEPQMFVYVCMVRVVRLWQLVPHKISDSESTVRGAARMLVGCWYGVVFVLAIVALVVRRNELLSSPIVWGLLLCFTFTAVHSIYWSNMRMRAPLMPFVCMLAAIGAAAICDRMCRRKA